MGSRSEAALKAWATRRAGGAAAKPEKVAKPKAKAPSPKKFTGESASSKFRDELARGKQRVIRPKWIR